MNKPTRKDLLIEILIFLFMFLAYLIAAIGSTMLNIYVISSISIKFFRVLTHGIVGIGALSFALMAIFITISFIISIKEINQDKNEIK